MKRCLAAALCLLTATLLPAQTLLKASLQPVPADETVFLSQDQTNIRVAPLVVDTAIKPRAYAVPDKAAARQGHKAALIRFADPAAQAADFSGHTDVFRAVDQLQRYAGLLAWTADARYADRAEAWVFNELLAALHRPSMERHVAAQAVADACQMVYMTDAEGLYVNFFLNSFVRVKTDRLSFTLDQVTDLPFSPHACFRVGGIKSQTPLTLRIRLPWWQATPPTVTLNGREETFPTENGYLVIKRNWNRGDEVAFDLDLTPRLEGDFLRIGPLLYAATSRPTLPVEPTTRATEFGHAILAGQGFTAAPLMDGDAALTPVPSR